jgi:hypothetical protein
MSGFKIEKGVPVPFMATGGGFMAYPWPDMQHGDSILVPWTDRYRKCRANGKRSGSDSAAVSAYAWVKKNRPGWKVVTRLEGDAYRIWFLDANRNGAENATNDV